MTLVTAAADV